MRWRCEEPGRESRIVTKALKENKSTVGVLRSGPPGSRLYATTQDAIR